MKPKIILSFLVATAAFLLFACGGGGDTADSGGIGGTGIYATGAVTAKGSITLTGVKHETNNARIFMDGVEVSDDSMIKVGMIVEVEGTVNDDGISGNAAVVRFDDSVEGPITAIDTTARELTVLGQTVLVDDLTIFDNSSISPPNITGLDVGDIVEVSGQLDVFDNIRATHIEMKPLSTEVEVTGFVTGKSGTTFMIGGLTVEFNGATLSNFGVGEPEDGDFVEVKGAAVDFDEATSTLEASSVENKARDIDDGLEAEVEGFVDSLTTSGFTVVTPTGRFEVQVDGATIYSGGVAADVQVGTKVEAEGQISGNILFADKVKFKDGIRIEVAAADADGTTLTVELRLLPAITVNVDDRTELEDNRSTPSPTTDPAVFLDSINTNDALKIRGRLVGGEVLATELKVDDPASDLDQVELRGPVDSDPTDTQFLTIIGITIDTGTTGTTFEDFNENPISRTAFFNLVQAGTLVEAGGNLNAGGDQIDADELELED